MARGCCFVKVLWTFFCILYFSGEIPYNKLRENRIPGRIGEMIQAGGTIMAKRHPFLTLLTGAALAGGVAYLMKKNNEKAAEPAVDTNDIPDADPAEGSWRATGEAEFNAEEMKARFKEEATKAFGTFKEEAKNVSGEILVGLKKLLNEVKASVEEAKKAAAERSAAQAENAEETCECAKEKAECCCEEAAEKAEEVKECCCEKAEEVKEAVEEAAEDLKEVVEDVIEEVKEAVED